MAIDMESIRRAFEEKLAAAREGSDIEELRVKMLGKKGQITDTMKNLRALSDEERREAGRRINELKAEIDQALTAKKAEFERAAMEARIQSAERYDVTAPSKEDRGSLHPMVTDVLLDRKSLAAELVGKPYVEDMIARHRAGVADASKPIWLLLNLNLFCDAYRLGT